MSEQEESDFVFVGEALVLDLINTLVVTRGKQRDLLDGPADLALWWQAARQRYPEIELVRGESPAYDIALLTAVRALRDSLRRLFTGVIQGEQPGEAEIQELNAVLQRGYPVLEWQEGELPQAVYGLHDSTQNALLLPVALSALQLLTQADLSRLHQCHNQRCILLFYDSSRSATRQWCSTACFDRERSSRRYLERKSAQ